MSSEESFEGGIINQDGEYQEVHVHASVSETAELINRLYNARTWKKDVGDSDVKKVENGCFVLRQKGHEWSQVMFSNPTFDHLQAANELSGQTDQKVIFVAHSDAAGTLAYELFQSGERLEFYLEEMGGGI